LLAVLTVAGPPSPFLQGVIWFRLTEGPIHLVANQYFKLKRLDGGDHDHH